MEKLKIKIDVRNMPNVAERLREASAKLDKIEPKEHAQIASDDEKKFALDLT